MQRRGHLQNTAAVLCFVDLFKESLWRGVFCPFTTIISCASKISRTCLSRARAREKFCLSAICHTLSVNLLCIKGLTAKNVWQIFRDLQSLTQKWPFFVKKWVQNKSFLDVFWQVWADLWQITVVFSSKKHLFCCNNHRYHCRTIGMEQLLHRSWNNCFTYR